MEPDIGPESRFLDTPPAFDAPVNLGEVPDGILLYDVRRGKTRMVWLPDDEKKLTI